MQFMQILMSMLKNNTLKLLMHSKVFKKSSESIIQWPIYEDSHFLNEWAIRMNQLNEWLTH